MMREWGQGSYHISIYILHIFIFDNMDMCTIMIEPTEDAMKCTAHIYSPNQSSREGGEHSDVSSPCDSSFRSVQV